MVKDCCTNPNNLRVTEQRGDLVVKTCHVCQCRHFEVTVDPGKFGVDGSKL
jgi:hypothetical protein